MSEPSSDPTELARAEALALMGQWELRPGHARHVAWLAARLFDQLVPLHGLGARERVLLEAAAYLHDIGHFNHEGEPGSAHHKQSARLIREHPWKQFAPAEAEIIAQVARYHRKAVPDLTHDDFRSLDDSARRTVRVLAACLRLGDSFDRSHSRFVQDVLVSIQPAQLTIRLQATRLVVRELEASMRKADLARDVFLREVLIEMEIVSTPAPSA